MAEQGRFRCSECGYTTDWFIEGEQRAGAEEIHYHSVTEHPDIVAEIAEMPPGLARQRRIQRLEQAETRGAGGSGGCLVLIITTLSSVVVAAWALLTAW
ncbi:MAG: hypothetical protein HOV66_02010 [Streptomycetaceae bacterium]|nr:hypothetical protein [Streptomycetaceae bacterium]NUS53625.1 hypothetical protein [Streptomycetaceae bacterium]